MGASILVIDDDLMFQNFLAFVLREDGYRVVCAGSAVEMEDQLRKDSFDLLLLDMLLPDEDGMVLIRRLRARGSVVPIIVLTARTERAALLTAFELGADDYITKPFDPKEVLLRVRAVCARGKHAGGPTHPPAHFEIRFNGWILNPHARSLRSPGNQEVHLTFSEFNILQALVARPGWVLTRDQLLDAITSGADSPSPRMIDVFITQLRAKMEADPAKPGLIVTVRGQGYRFAGSVE